ncbi:hypothetical protein VTL71DRAFT_10027 [Oculimacula yallundae]|uniref:Uncharacterized protein n=1 Tax=Oculimacula yallundae TaxID=86028 RepID=A0ABR4BQ52_9HELO
MYVEVTNAIKAQKDVARELSKFEGQAAIIFQKIKKAHEKEEAGISITRMERNLLRKFLFVMKYRGPGFFMKYFEDDPQAYDFEDKHLLRGYMAEKGTKSPRELWLHNLRIILGLNMDACGDWIEILPGLMFSPDAAMFTFHAQSSYMAFCMPEEKHDEFILTDQCNNVFEGPTNETFVPERRNLLERHTSVTTSSVLYPLDLSLFFAAVLCPTLWKIPVPQYKEDAN